MRLPNDKELKAFTKAREATKDNLALPTRVNIIFHGLLSFQDSDPNYYDVLIPKTTCNNHLALYGNPCVGAGDQVAGLYSFPSSGVIGPGPVFLSFEGIFPEPPARRSFPSATNVIVLAGSQVTPQLSSVLVVIRVPKPFQIRHYRGGETHLQPIAVDSPTQSVLKRNPDVIHEVTVFSYVSFYNPRLVGPGVNYAIPQPNLNLPMLNIGIYSQPTGSCDDTDSKDFDAMYLINPSTKLNLELATNFRVDDGPPLWTSPQVGVSFAEMLALSELAQDPYLEVCQLLGCAVNGANPQTTCAEALGQVAQAGIQMPGTGPGERLEAAVPGGCGQAFACDDSN